MTRVLVATLGALLMLATLASGVLRGPAPAPPIFWHALVGGGLLWLTGVASRFQRGVIWALPLLGLYLLIALLLVGRSAGPLFALLMLVTALAATIVGSKGIVDELGDRASRASP